MKVAGVQCVAILLVVVTIVGTGIMQTEARAFLKGSKKNWNGWGFDHDNHHDDQQPQHDQPGKPGCDDQPPIGNGGWPSPDYSSPSPVYSSPSPDYSSPSPVYTSPSPVYSSPSPDYSSPSPVYTSPSPVYSSPSPGGY
jgi:hypothetical protein